MKPRIAIPLPTSFDLAYNRLNAPSYADAVRACGGEPVEFALDLSYAELVRSAASCDAILLPGSPADVDPAKYGQEADEATAPADTSREAVDEFLLADAFALRKPILGICFGTQMLNVFRGGTLIQDLTVMPVNHSAGRSVAVAHFVTVTPDSLLDALMDHSELQPGERHPRLPVNSSHHQAVGIAGDGLTVSARCVQDGVAEAVETEQRDGHFVLGVQWHPERTFESSASSKRLFCRFVEHASAWRAAAGAAKSLAV
jgi:putative glutamine amidotransferase